MWSSQGTPLSRSCSRPVVTNCSTSAAESPWASAWTVTIVGENSGRAATLASRSWNAPKPITTTATPTTRTRNLRLSATSSRIMKRIPLPILPL